MNEMVERVARALAVSHYEDKDPEFMWRHMVPDARAAIEAMRKPTEDMRLAAPSDRAIDEVWFPMIDAALQKEATA